MGILVIFRFHGYFGHFLDFGVFLSLFRFSRYFGHFFGFGGILVIFSVRAGNETVGLNLTWAHNLFIGWALGFPTLGCSRHKNSE